MTAGNVTDDREINNKRIIKSGFLKGSFKNSTFKNHIIVGIYLWIVNQLLFYNAVTNLEKMETQIRYATTLFFIAHIIANLCTGIFSNYLGIDKTIIYFSYLTVILLVILIFFPKLHDYIGMLVFFLFNLFSRCLGQTVYLFIPTLFESQVRATAGSYTKIPAKIILVISPFFILNVTYLYTFFALLVGFVPLILFFFYKPEESFQL